MFSSKNYFKNYIHDKDLLDKYNYELSRIGINEDGICNKKKPPRLEFCKQSFNDKMKTQFTFKRNEETERKLRLNTVFNIQMEEEQDSFERKKKKIAKKFKQPFGIVIYII